MASWRIQTAPLLEEPDQARLAASILLWLRLLLAIEDGDPAEAVVVTHSARAATAQSEVGEFEAFFHVHERDIFTYLWRMTGDEQAAYDLAQETFLRAWRHFTRIRKYERPGGWLFRVATHLALNYLRDRAAALQRMVMSSDAMVCDPVARVADADTVRRALMAIAPRQRAALVLREVYGLPYREVANALGISAGAAKTLLWRARGEFRDRYAEEAR